MTKFQDRWFSWLLFIPAAFFAQTIIFKLLDFFLLIYVSFMELNPQSVLYVLFNGTLLAAVGSFIYFFVGTSFFTRKQFLAGILLGIVIILLWTLVAVDGHFWGGFYFLFIYSIFTVYHILQLKYKYNDKNY